MSGPIHNLKDGTVPNSLTVEDRRVKVSKLRLLGYSLTKIANELGVCRRTIVFDVRVLRKRMMQQANINTTRRFAVNLAKTHLLYREAMEAWERSKEDEVFETVVTGGDKTEHRTTTKSQTGNPAYLAEAIKCIRHEADICGLTDRDRLDRADAEKSLQPLVPIMVHTREEAAWVDSMRCIDVVHLKRVVDATQVTEADSEPTEPDPSSSTNDHVNSPQQGDEPNVD
jgi:hypothetical protein